MSIVIHSFSGAFSDRSRHCRQPAGSGSIWLKRSDCSVLIVGLTDCSVAITLRIEPPSRRMEPVRPFRSQRLAIGETCLADWHGETKGCQDSATRYDTGLPHVPRLTCQLHPRKSDQLPDFAKMQDICRIAVWTERHLAPLSIEVWCSKQLVQHPSFTPKNTQTPNNNNTNNTLGPMNVVGESQTSRRRHW